MYPVLFTVGPYTLYSYGFLMFVGIVAAILVIRPLAARSGIDPWRITLLGIALAFAGFLGAHLLYVLTRLWFGGLRWKTAWEAMRDGNQMWYGALIFGMPFAWWYMRRSRLPVWCTFDILMTGIPLGLAIGRIGCFLGGCCYGKPTDTWLGVRFYSPVAAEYAGVPLHPTQLYEAGGLLLLFLYQRRLFRTRRFDGQVFLAYLLFYPALRIVIEVFRGDPTRQFIIHPVVSVNQVISAGIGLFALTMLWRRLRQLGNNR